MIKRHIHRVLNADGLTTEAVEVVLFKDYEEEALTKNKLIKEMANAIKHSENYNIDNDEYPILYDLISQARELYNV